MLNFNILPLEEKNLINRYRNIKIIVVWGGSIFVLCALAALLLVPSYFYLIFQRDGVLYNLEVTEKSQFVKRIEDVRVSLAELNKNAEDLKKNAGSAGVFSGIFSDLISALPSGIVITAIRFDAVSSELSLNGFAGTRLAFVEMETAIKNIPRIKNVTLPLASLVLNSNIPFNIRVNVQNND